MPEQVNFDRDNEQVIYVSHNHQRVKSGKGQDERLLYSVATEKVRKLGDRFSIVQEGTFSIMAALSPTA